ncbi:MAG: thioredoxin domain-containing protein [Minicystis sp.]
MDPAVAAPAAGPIYRVPIGSSAVRGSADALVTLVEFTDYQCPFCFRADDTVRALRDKYGADLRVVLKHEPLPFHKLAEPASELAFEARAQKGDDAYWAVHDLLMAQRGQLDADDLRDIADEAGLDVDKAMSNVAMRKHAAQLTEDSDLADDVGAGGTPTFFINGRKLVGAQPMERFVALIDAELAAARAMVAGGVARDKVYDTIQQGAVMTELERVDVPAPTADSPSRGPADAKVVVQVFSDFQCPFCSRVEPTLAQLEGLFPGQIRVVWRNHPLPFHAFAKIAAEAALEARAQKGDDAFWKMHALLMANQASINRAAIEVYATGLGLDMDRFRKALDQGIHRAAIDADVKVAEAAGLAGTPSFAVNGYKLIGAQPLIRFKKVVQRALADLKQP